MSIQNPCSIHKIRPIISFYDIGDSKIEITIRCSKSFCLFGFTILVDEIITDINDYSLDVLSEMWSDYISGNYVKPI